jgi:hypothetical protein
MCSKFINSKFLVFFLKLNFFSQTNAVKILNQASQVAKGCTSSCTPSSSNFFGQGAFVYCCDTDYCNLSTRNQLSLSISIFFITIFGFIF